MTETGKCQWDGLRRLKKTRDEEEEQKKRTEELLEKKRIQEDELWQEFEDNTQMGANKKKG